MQTSICFPSPSHQKGFRRLLFSPIEMYIGPPSTDPIKTLPLLEESREVHDWVGARSGEDRAVQVGCPLPVLLYTAPVTSVTYMVSPSLDMVRLLQSVSGGKPLPELCQVWPPSLDFHTSPSADAATMILPSLEIALLVQFAVPQAACEAHE